MRLRDPSAVSTYRLKALLESISSLPDGGEGKGQSRGTEPGCRSEDPPEGNCREYDPEQSGGIWGREGPNGAVEGLGGVQLGHRRKHGWRGRPLLEPNLPPPESLTLDFTPVIKLVLI